MRKVLLFFLSSLAVQFAMADDEISCLNRDKIKSNVCAIKDDLDKEIDSAYIKALSIASDKDAIKKSQDDWKRFSEKCTSYSEEAYLSQCVEAAGKIRLIELRSVFTPMANKLGSYTIRHDLCLMKNPPPNTCDDEGTVLIEKSSDGGEKVKFDLEFTDSGYGCSFEGAIISKTDKLVAQEPKPNNIDGGQCQLEFYSDGSSVLTRVNRESSKACSYLCGARAMFNWGYGAKDK